jgi:hypothetical protein
MPEIQFFLQWCFLSLSIQENGQEEKNSPSYRRTVRHLGST